jgi:hypothetical protein
MLTDCVCNTITGLVPKLAVVGPKLIFSFTVAQHMISYLDAKVSAYTMLDVLHYTHITIPHLYNSCMLFSTSSLHLE